MNEFLAPTLTAEKMASAFHYRTMVCTGNKCQEKCLPEVDCKLHLLHFTDQWRMQEALCERFCELKAFLSFRFC